MEDKLKEALKGVSCVIIGQTQLGTRIIVIGKSVLRHQLDELAKQNNVTI